MKLLSILLLTTAIFAIDWQKDYDKALEIASKENKPVLVVLMRDSCPYCQKLQSETLTNSVISSTVSKNFVPLYIDVENAPDQVAKSKLRFQGVPASFVVDSNGKQKTKLFGYQAPMIYMGFLQQGM
jgi:thioredoxin-related protein